MAKVIRNIKEMINEILKEVEGQDNYRAIVFELMPLDTDLIVDGENRYQECYDALVELGEQRIADKYIKPLI
ncbi:hypothetical protein [Anaerococcus sp. Marseille-P3625]|uniref:hypothetical protein n=1 Tax=Anaerococcus sp. Marseille-P3625 TaxID=1977277 RepID=UPI000C06F879|nr:hypothetical protein [Anaerococcus sp. Marseille-P3625]